MTTEIFILNLNATSKFPCYTVEFGDGDGFGRNVPEEKREALRNLAIEIALPAYERKISASKNNASIEEKYAAKNALEDAVVKFQKAASQI